MSWLKYETKKDAEFPMLVNFAIGLFIFELAVSGDIWLLLVCPLNLGIAAAIYIRNFTGTPTKENKNA